MGDISAEPSMEEILSSIKRIIAEEGDGTPPRPRRGRPAPLPSHSIDAAPFEDEQVLELTSPIPSPAFHERPFQEPTDDVPPMNSRAQPLAPEPAPKAPLPTAEPIASEPTVQASRASLDSLSRLFVKPEPGSDGTLEALVREMLRPMLREWMDAHLPPMVENMVAQEIARITRQG